MLIAYEFPELFFPPTRKKRLLSQEARGKAMLEQSRSRAALLNKSEAAVLHSTDLNKQEERKVHK
jgi:hypothetical protein